MDSNKHAVAATGLLVAAMRAEENLRDDALFRDPFAERLAGEDGRRLLAESVAATGQPAAPIVVRTKLYDESLLGGGHAQAVILAAGMDARSYRLPWPVRLRLGRSTRPPTGRGGVSGRIGCR